MIEISLRLAGKFQNRGIGTSLAKAITLYGTNKLKISKIHAVIHPENGISLKVFRNLGYQDKEDIMYHGKKMKLLFYQYYSDA